MQATSESHTTSREYTIFAILDKAKPDTENIKRLKRGGGQAYERSSD
jgi:hypothetical protein